MKRALATVLTVLGISFAAHSPASAGAGAIPGLAAPLAQTAGDTVTTVGFDGGPCCFWDLPIIGAGVAFWELFRDNEFNYHCCNRRWEGYSRHNNYRYSRANYRYSGPPRHYRSPCW